MRRALKLHPESVCEAVTRIEVAVRRPAPRALVLHYFITGTVAGVLLPLPAASTRGDVLWEHTCFEAFIQSPGEEAYRELNFAPSTQWAAYRFDSYRTGMREADLSRPHIDVRTADDRLVLEVELELSGTTPLRLGLSAVIEEKNGRKSWWALAHPPGPPDFHHPDCFALELPADPRPSSPRT